MTNSTATKNDLFTNYKLTNIQVFEYLIPDILKGNPHLKRVKEIMQFHLLEDLIKAKDKN